LSSAGLSSAGLSSAGLSSAGLSSAGLSPAGLSSAGLRPASGAYVESGRTGNPRYFCRKRLTSAPVAHDNTSGCRNRFLYRPLQVRLSRHF
ncbi:MAG: hypothetical protein K2H15_01020, partial [Muribaculaceae bacterium]|nr:hypothetical protein [Muribaculaceae bacterium]